MGWFLSLCSHINCLFFFNINTVFLYRHKFETGISSLEHDFSYHYEKEQFHFLCSTLFSVTSTLTNINAATDQHYLKYIAYITYVIYQSFAFQWKLAYCTEHLWLSTYFYFFLPRLGTPNKAIYVDRVREYKYRRNLFQRSLSYLFISLTCALSTWSILFS